MQDGISIHASHAENGVVACHTQQTETNHQHAGDGATAEGNLHGGIQTFMGSLCGTHIGAYRNVHADIAGKTGEDSTNQETSGCGHIEENSDYHQQNNTGNGDSGVLTI